MRRRAPPVNRGIGSAIHALWTSAPLLSPLYAVRIRMPSTIERPLPQRPRLQRGRVRHPARVRLWHSFLRLTTVVVLAGLTGGGWYLAKKGFSRNWRDLVVEELHKRGVEASVRRLTLDPFRGLIARDVRIYDYRRREKTLAMVSEISLDINYAALFHHQPFLNALDIRNGELTIPLPATPGHVSNAELKRFRAHVYFPPERIEVRQAEGIFCGIRISASGQLIKRESYRPSETDSAEAAAARLRLLQTLVTTLQRFRYPAGPPELQVKFSGDLSQLDDAHVEATLRGNRIVHEEYVAQNVYLAGEWKEHALSLPRMEWSDHSGRVAATATWNEEDRRADFKLRSSADLKPLLAGFGFDELLQGISFQSPPQIEASGFANVGGETREIKVTGRVALDRFAFRDVPFENFSCDFAWDGARTMLRDIRLRQRSGELAADLLDAPNDFRLNLESSIPPSSLSALLPENLRPFLESWEWQRPPAIHLTLRGASRDPGTWRGEGNFTLGRSRFRGVWMNNASASFRFGDGAIRLENFRVNRDEGSGSGSFVYDDRKHELRLTNVVSTLKPSEAIMWVEPRFWEHVVPYRFHRPPHVTVNGVVQFAGGKQTHLELNVDAPSGMDYTFIDKVLPLDKVSGQLLFTDDRLQILNLKGTLFSGSITGGADISLARNDHHYSARVAVERIDFPSVTDLYFKYKTSQGALSGKFDFGGANAEKQALRGTGFVRVTNGNVFAIPVFGPLSELLSKMFSGAGYSIAHEADAPFTIKDGVIHTDNLTVQGRLFAMLVHGDLNFLKNSLDFDIRISAGGPGAVLTPLYKLFEYHGEGTLSKPVWKPKRF